VNALSGTADPFTADTAVGFAEPELDIELDAFGLGEDEPAVPLAVVDVTTVEDGLAVEVAPEARADRT
jgi:hypothetical protein